MTHLMNVSKLPEEAVTHDGKGSSLRLITALGRLGNTILLIMTIQITMLTAHSGEVALVHDDSTTKYDSFEAAIEASRKIGPDKKRHLVISGDHIFLDQPIHLDHRDSNLSISGEPGQRPILYGGRQLTGWRRHAQRIWVADVPISKDQPMDFRLLLVNGKLAEPSRFPSSGFLHHRNSWNVKWLSTSGGGWAKKPSQQQLTTLLFKPEDIADSFDLRSAEVTILHKWDESLAQVARVDRKRNTIHLRQPTGHPPGAFNVDKYYFNNLPQGLTKPGQWFLDRIDSKIYYWPRPGERMKNAVVIAPNMDHIIKIHGTAQAPVHDIKLSNLELMVCNAPAIAAGFGAHHHGGAIDIHYSNGGLIENLHVSHVLGHGINIRKCERFVIRQNSIHHLGAGGIKFNGIGIEVTQNQINTIGLSSAGAIAIWGTGSDSVIHHNTIYECPYSGIMVNGSGHQITHNEIYKIMNKLNDGGGIYTTFCNNIKISGNVVRDLPPGDASAYYLDEQSVDCVVYNNLALRVARPLLSHMSQRNTIRQNVFLNPPGIRLEFPKSSQTELYENIISTEGNLKMKNADALRRFNRNILNGKSLEIEPPLAKQENTLANPGIYIKGDTFRIRQKKIIKALHIDPDLFDLAGAKTIN